MSHKLIGLKARLTCHCTTHDERVYEAGTVLLICDYKLIGDRYFLADAGGNCVLAAVTSDMFEILPEDDKSPVFGAEPEPEEACCDNCRFHSDNALNISIEFGECRANPPVIVNSLDKELFQYLKTLDDSPAGFYQKYEHFLSNATRFPITHISDWCGKHERREPQ